MTAYADSPVFCTSAQSWQNQEGVFQCITWTYNLYRRIASNWRHRAGIL